MPDLEVTGQHRRLRSSAIRSTTTAAALAKGITAVVQLALVPLTLGYLGQSSYGIWMAVSAAVAFLQISDLGIGNALISLSAQQRVSGGVTSAIHLLKKALVMSGMIGGIVFAVGYVAIENTNWPHWLSIPTNSEGDAYSAMIACLLMFCISMPLALAQQVRLGLLQGYSNSIFQAIGQLLNLLFVWVGVQVEVGLAAIVVLSTLGVLIGNFLNLVFLIVLSRSSYEHSEKIDDHSPSLRNLISRSLPFLVLQLTGLFVYQSDVLVVSHFLGPTDVTTYSISMKYFSIPILILGFYLYSLWPAYADAKAREDWVWINNFFFKSLGKSLIFSGAMAVFFFVTSFFVLSWWTSGQVTAEPMLVALLACHVGLNALGGNLASFMNGLHMLKLQTVLAIVGAVATILLSLYLTPKLGMSGPVAAMVVLNAITYGIMFLGVHKKIKEISMATP